MSKFKVGDKAKVTDLMKTYNTYKDWFTENHVKKLLEKYVIEPFNNGTKVTVMAIGKHRIEDNILVAIKRKNGSISLINETGLELIESAPQQPKIVITPKKKGKVSAVLFNGDTYVKLANAKCSPDDTYDFNIGAKLAFNRLMGIEDKPQEQSKVKEVKRHAIAGEYVKVVNAESVPCDNGKPCYKNGDIIKIVRSDDEYTRFKDGFSDNGRAYALLDSEYVVLENYNPNSADTFDWEKFKKGEIAVKCPTEELAINFLTECDKRKIKWVNERKATSETNFYSYKEKTYYGFGFGCLGYGSIERECFKEHYKSSIEWTTNGAVIPQKLDLSHVTNEELIAELTKRLEQ